MWVIPAQVRSSATLNALATMALALPVVIAVVGFLLWRAVRATREQMGPTVGEFATLDAESIR
jgi:hypothetical protein